MKVPGMLLETHKFKGVASSVSWSRQCYRAGVLLGSGGQTCYYVAQIYYFCLVDQGRTRRRNSWLLENYLASGIRLSSFVEETTDGGQGDTIKPQMTRTVVDVITCPPLDQLGIR